MHHMLPSNKNIPYNPWFIRYKKALFISAATIIFFSAAASYFVQPKKTPDLASAEKVSDRLALRAEDHVAGNREAPITIIEYSSVECDSCKKLHTVFKEILRAYPAEIAWVFRHSPQTTHPKSFREAEALECAWEQGGDDTFFRYLNQLFQTTRSDNSIDLALLPHIAGDIGLNTELFATCLEDRRFIKRVNQDLYTGEALGVTVKPHLFILTPRDTISLSGYQSYAAIEALITGLSQKP